MIVTTLTAKLWGFYTMLIHFMTENVLKISSWPQEDVLEIITYVGLGITILAGVINIGCGIEQNDEKAKEDYIKWGARILLASPFISVLFVPGIYIVLIVALPILLFGLAFPSVMIPLRFLTFMLIKLFISRPTLPERQTTKV